MCRAKITLPSSLGNYLCGAATFALPARLTAATIDYKLMLKNPKLPRWRAMIPQGTAPRFDGCLQNFLAGGH